MCRPQSEGGARCASHTRPAFNRVVSMLNGLGPDDSGQDTAVSEAELEASREQVRAAGFDAFADHASTPAGREEVDRFLHEQEFAPYPAHSKDNMVGWVRSAIAEGDKRRAISKDVEAQLRAQRPSNAVPITRAEILAPDMELLEAGWDHARSVITNGQDAPDYPARLHDARRFVVSYASTKAGQADIERWIEDCDTNGAASALPAETHQMLRDALREGEATRQRGLTVSERLAEEREAEREIRSREEGLNRFSALAATVLPSGTGQPAPAAEQPRRSLFARIAEIGLAGEVGPLAPRLLGRRRKG